MARRKETLDHKIDRLIATALGFHAAGSQGMAIGQGRIAIGYMRDKFNRITGSSLSYHPAFAQAFIINDKGGVPMGIALARRALEQAQEPMS